MTSLSGLGIMTYIYCHLIDESKPITEIFLKIAETLTKDKYKLGP